jgi:hypothetical protein
VPPDEPPCECPDAGGHCARYGLDQAATHVLLCRTRPDYRAEWARRAVTRSLPVASTTAAHRAAVVTRPLPVVRVPCKNEGDVVEPCRGCGSEGRHVRECDVFGLATYVACGKVKDGKPIAVCQGCDSYVPDPTVGN